ncbi:MAG: diguanylate cyclase, partial [Polyangiaceae bacterium]|nr:diguanylate cyclase [Polyangiaceae bacterium]
DVTRTTDPNPLLSQGILPTVCAYAPKSRVLVTRGRARQIASQVQLSRVSRDLAPILGFLVLALVLVSVYFGQRVRRTIEGPLRETLTALETVAGGDLSPALPAGKTDEFGRIATSLNTAIGRMRSDREQIERLAATDPLTGLMNRRAFVATLQHEVVRSRRYGLPLTMLLIDIDHFKQVNDLHGHATGDLVLARVGKLLVAQLRTTDYVARWGGEEFVAALPHVGLDGAAVAAGRLRVACGEMDVALVATTLRVTLSIGIAELARDDTPQTLTDRADHAMYAAKRQGRNRVVIDDGHLDAEAGG